MTLVDDESVYLPGQRRKKMAMMIMSTVAWSKLEVGERFVATKAMCLEPVLELASWVKPVEPSASRQLT